MPQFTASVKGVKADLHKKVITLTFSVPLSSQEDAETLTEHMGEDASDVILIVDPLQMSMPMTKVSATQ